MKRGADPGWLAEMRLIPEDREKDQSVDQEHTCSNHRNEAGVAMPESTGRTGMDALAPAEATARGQGGGAGRCHAPLGAGEHRQADQLVGQRHSEMATFLGRIRIQVFGVSARILFIPSLLRPMSAMKPLCASMALLLGLAVAPVLPARASGPGTAAWSTAGSICRALGAGLAMSAAVRVGYADNAYLWSAEMRDPSFRQLMVHEAARQCPEQLIRAVNEGRSQL